MTMQIVTRRTSAGDCPSVAPAAHPPCSRQIPLVVAVAIAHEHRVSKNESLLRHHDFSTSR